MRVIIQKVSKASVTIEDNVVSEIKNGLLIFLGIETTDIEEDVTWLVKKLQTLESLTTTMG